MQNLRSFVARPIKGVGVLIKTQQNSRTCYTPNKPIPPKEIHGLPFLFWKVNKAGLNKSFKEG